MNRRWVVVLLVGLAAVAYGETPVTLSAGDSTFSFVNEDGLDYWLRSNKSYHIRRSQLHLDSGDYTISPILLLEEHESRTHMGIEGTRSRLRLSAWEMSTSKLGDKLWVIEAKADAWKWEAHTVTFIKYGCCGEPDKVESYRVKDGKPLDS